MMVGRIDSFLGQSKILPNSSATVGYISGLLLLVYHFLKTTIKNILEV